MTGSPASRWEAQLRAVQAGGQGGKHRGSVLRSQPPWCDLILKSSGLQAFPLTDGTAHNPPISIIPISIYSRKLQGTGLCYCRIEPLHTASICREVVSRQTDKSRV